MKNISRLLILSSILLSCMLISCDREEEDCIKILPAIGCGQGLITFNTEEYSTLATDSMSIIDVRLEQTCLIVDFAYSGCDYREVGVMAVVVQTPSFAMLQAKISNEDPQDACLAFFMHSDTFDLTSTDLDLFDGMVLNVHQWGDAFILDVD